MLWIIKDLTYFGDFIKKTYNRFKNYISSILTNKLSKALGQEEQQRILVDTQSTLLNELRDMENRFVSHLNEMESRWDRNFLENNLIKVIPRLRRNILPNDSSAVQKTLIAMWQNNSKLILGYKDLLDSGFRVFSQNDEDGVLLRIFTHIGQLNKVVVEIGSNCADSDVGIPENLSTNLIVNHGWHGIIFEVDHVECNKMRYFFARIPSTKHFHIVKNEKEDYYSPVIVHEAVCPENIDNVIKEKTNVVEPDLLVIDIDGGDLPVISNMNGIQPRVLVVEFEKRFRDRHSVVQYDSSNFSKRWPQSGTASLPAWEKLLQKKGYSLCAIGTCGFNAFFVRSDIVPGRINTITSCEAFDEHPILSKVTDEFWILPDETWQEV